MGGAQKTAEAGEASDRARRDQDRWAGREPHAGSRTRGSSAAAATTSTTSAARHAAHGDPAQPARARPHQSRSTRRKAWEIPGVRLVLTGEMMAQRNLAWMPTLSYDTQAVLATDKVRFQGQEVCVRRRRRPVHRQGRLRGDRRRVRAAARHRQPGAGGGGRRAGDPRRQGGADRQHLLPLGGRRQPRPPSGPSRRPTSSPRSSCTTRAATRRRSSAAARSPTTTRAPPSSPST